MLMQSSRRLSVSLSLPKLLMLAITSSRHSSRIRLVTFVLYILLQASGRMSVTLGVSLGSPKLLMLELVEAAAASSMVRATPGAPNLHLL